MNPFIKNILFVFSVGLILFSCEKEVEFKSELIKPQIVIKSILRPGVGVTAIIQKSRSVLDDKRYFEALPNAKVLLFENGEFLKELQYVSRIDTSRIYLYDDKYEKIPYETGMYSDTTVVIKAGANYQLEVSSNGLKDAWCETTVPLPIELSNFKCIKEKVYHEYDENYFKMNVQVEIKEPGDEEDYYRINCASGRGVELATLKMNNGGYSNGYGSGYGGSYYGGSYPSTSVNLDSIQPTDTIVIQSEYSWHFFSTDPVLSSTDLVDLFDSESTAQNIFSDVLFNGENYNLSFWVETRQDVYTELGEFFVVAVGVEHLSKELYKYTNSVEQQSEVLDNPFAEPVPVYSNVEGGLGIFGSQTTSFGQAVFGKIQIDGKTYIDYNTYREIYEGWNDPYSN